MPVIASKYAGRCKGCGGHFPAGASINWTKTTGARHIACAGSTSTAPATSAPSSPATSTAPATMLTQHGAVMSPRMARMWTFLRAEGIPLTDFSTDSSVEACITKLTVALAHATELAADIENLTKRRPSARVTDATFKAPAPTSTAPESEIDSTAARFAALEID
jgi:hypothetical protein